MMRCARRYRQMLAEYEKEGPRLKERLGKLQGQLNVAEKEWKRYGKHCGFTDEEIVKMDGRA